MPVVSGFQLLPTVCKPVHALMHMCLCRKTLLQSCANHASTLLWRRVHSHIMAMFQRQKDAGRVVPFVDDTTLRCKARLPWWSGHKQQQGEAFYPLAAEVKAAAAAAVSDRTTT